MAAPPFHYSPPCRPLRSKTNENALTTVSRRVRPMSERRGESEPITTLLSCSAWPLPVFTSSLVDFSWIFSVVECALTFSAIYSGFCVVPTPWLIVSTHQSVVQVVRSLLTSLGHCEAEKGSEKWRSGRWWKQNVHMILARPMWVGTLVNSCLLGK